MLDADRIGPTIAAAGDAEFLRRVSLDLAGMPPSTEELRSFLADQDPEKRARAVDRLLDGPQFARLWATTLDVMLMERLANDQVPAEEWQAFLLDAARRNQPFDALVAELLRADGVDPEATGAGAVLPGSRVGSQPDHEGRRPDLLRGRPAMRRSATTIPWSRITGSPTTRECWPSLAPGRPR